MEEQNNLFDNLVSIVRRNDCLELKNALNSKEKLWDSLTQASFSIPKIEMKHVNFTSLTLLHVAAFFDSLECFVFMEDYLLTKNMSQMEILSVKTAEGYFPLHYALVNASYEVAEYIIQNAPDQTGLATDIPNCPLTLAVIGRMEELLQSLFRAHPGPMDQGQINQAFQMAIAIGYYPCLEILIDKQTSKFREDEEPILMRAVSTFSPQVASLVMKHNKNEFTKTIQKTINGKPDIECFLSRLFFSASKNPAFKPIIIEALELMENEVIEPKAQIRCRGVCHWLCLLGDVEIAKIVFKNFNVDVNRLDGNYQSGPYELIKADKPNEENVYNMLDFLIEKGFDPTREVIENGVLQQGTLLEKFVSRSLALQSRYGKPYLLKSIELLLMKKADPDCKMHSGKTIRKYVEEKRSKEMKELFIILSYF